MGLMCCTLAGNSRSFVFHFVSLVVINDIITPNTKIEIETLNKSAINQHQSFCSCLDQRITHSAL